MMSGLGDAKKQGHGLKKLTWALLLVRAVALILAVQMSNVAHAAVDVASAVFGYVAEHDDCMRDCEDDQCPPGCPKCHCASARPNVLPSDLIGLQPPPPRATTTSWSRSPTTEQPPSPLLSSVYRPPKVHRLFG